MRQAAARAGDLGARRARRRCRSPSSDRSTSSGRAWTSCPASTAKASPRVLASFMNALLRGEPLPLVDGGAAAARLHVGRTTSSKRSCASSSGPRRAAARSSTWAIPANDVSIRELGERLARAFARCVPEAPPARFAMSGRGVLRPGLRRLRRAGPGHRQGARAARLGARERASAEMLPAIVRRLRRALRLASSQQPRRRPRGARGDADEPRRRHPGLQRRAARRGVLERVAGGPGSRSARIVVVNDGSTDGTRRACRVCRPARCPRRACSIDLATAATAPR